MARDTQAKPETPRLEDYLEAIYHLIHEKGYAATVDISANLQVKPPTVSNMIRKLAGRGYLMHEPYRGMKLTAKGEKLARSVITRHTIVAEFLSMIGVEEGIAYEDTEGIEHHIHPVTIQRIERLVAYLKHNPTQMKTIRDHIDG